MFYDYLHQISYILGPEKHRWYQYQRVYHDRKVVHEKLEVVSKFVARFIANGQQDDATNEQDLVPAGNHIDLGNRTVATQKKTLPAYPIRCTLHCNQLPLLTDIHLF